MEITIGEVQRYRKECKMVGESRKKKKEEISNRFVKKGVEDKIQKGCL